MSKFEQTVDQEKSFYLNNGKELNSLRALYDEIHHMPDVVFFHHVTPERNDFANWVKDVIGDKTLAAKIAKAGTPIVLKETLAGIIEKNDKPAAAKAKTVTKAATPAKEAKAAAKPKTTTKKKA
jgi:hypothetical protein